MSQSRYWTVTVTDAVARPYWLVEYSVYVAVADGVNVTLLPRTGPTTVETRLYSAPFTLQFSVTAVPLTTVAGVAVKDNIAGIMPAGTFDGV